MRPKTFLVVVGIILGLSNHSCAADSREALVIGNSKYEGEAALENPGNDADTMTAALEALGFTVIKKKDLTLSQMEDALLAFRRILTKGGLGMFFYAGHGLQMRDENYLVPIGARIREEFEVKRQCLEVSQILEVLIASESNLKVVVLDCCRDNPLQRNWRRGNATKGLAGISNVPEGTLIAFSTSPNQTAADGHARNSPYTEQLAATLRSRPGDGLEISDVFRKASRAVKQRTGQVPWLNQEASLEEYYLWGKSSSPTPSRPSVPREITDSIGMKFALIPAGEFVMGNSDSIEATASYLTRTYGIRVILDETSEDSFRDEKPEHRVQITKPFYLGICEVTCGQFRQFVEKSGYRTEAEKDSNPGAIGWNAAKGAFEFDANYSWRNAGFAQTDEHPVVNVSWTDAVAFCEWLSRKEGVLYRLPTEAEWEYACRAGTTTRYCSGNDAETLAQVGNVADAAARAQFSDWPTISANDGYVFTAPVARFRQNAFGLFDMHGNVCELCADWRGSNYYKTSPLTDPEGAAAGDFRVCRGGGWSFHAGGCRAAYRGNTNPNARELWLGFRVVRAPAP